jgi:nucleosome binding factor SPN SPT16 subunit
VDIGVALSTAALAIKDEQELVSTRDASRTSARILQRYFVEEMSQIVDQDKTIKNSAFADRVMNKIEDAKFLTGLKISDDFHSENVDWATQPTVQSGGHYDLRFASEPDDQNMHAGIIVSALGIRYQSYASLVARTYLVDPSKEQEANYKLLVQIHETILSTIKDGITTREVYSKALNVLKQKRPDLEKHFQKNVGYGIGIETKDGTLMLSPKSGRTLKDGMTLVIQTGLQDIENKGSQAKKVKTYSLVLADTVRVAASKAINFTRDAKYDAEAVCFFFDDGEDEPQEKPKAKKDSRIGAVAQSNIVSKRLRAERQATDSAEKDAARREHQKKLHQRKQAEGLEKYAENKGALNGTEEKKFKRFQSYKREEDFPNRSKELMIVADSKNQSVLVPIMGRSVPFHINTIKNASTTAEGAFTSLRINFLSPGQGVGRKDDQPFEDPTAHFVRSLTFRSKDTDRMASIAGAITDMKKEYVRREQQKKQMEDVVEQDKLTIDRRPQKLDHVFLRPALDGKRVPGEVQIHQNGIRYVHGGISSSETVDVLFNNIRHLFFQPCKSELIVIIHVHLINPIMIGKRKTKDVQFYREATDIAFDETGNRKRKHRYGDEEEFEAEEEERKRRMELDKLFLSFARKVEEADKDNHVRVDVPFRDLGFNGVPARSSVWVQPSTDCLIQITEPPFMVLSLEDIEVVHLERVQVGSMHYTQQQPNGRIY